MSKFRRGTIAICSQGLIGLIVGTTEYEDGTPTYRGIQLGENREGGEWRSRDPKFVCHVDDLAKRFEGDPFVIPVTIPHGLTPCPALATPVVVDSPLEVALENYEREFWTPPQRDDDPAHDCSGGVVSHSPVASRPARRSCI